MNIIEDISSIGRSLGVFLILSMQRPDSKVLSREWEIFSWQPKQKKVFPYIILLSERKYDIQIKNIGVFQFRDVYDFLEHISY